MAVGKSYQGAWQAQSQQGAWQSAEVGGTVNLTGTAAITSAAVGALTVGITEALTGTAAIVAAVAGGLSVTWNLTGTAAIVCSVDGALTMGGVENVTGTAAIVSAVDGALLVTWALTGTSAITSSIDGALTVGILEALTGTAAITSSIDGALTLGILEALTGTAGIVAGVDGGLIVGWALTGTAPITTSVDADLTGTYHWLGMFYGYREYTAGWVGRIELPLWELDGRLPSWFEVYKGSAGDAWSAMQQFIDSRTGRLTQSLMVLIMAYTNEAEIRLSKDGVVYSDIVEVDPNMSLGGSFFRRYAGKGFSVRNKTPGKVADYQVLALW